MTALKCYDCGADIIGFVEFLDEPETCPDEIPMHPRCADQPWPLYFKRRAYVDADGRERTSHDTPQALAPQPTNGDGA